MVKIIKRKAPEFYERVGKHIVAWLKQNNKTRSKPGNQKELARMLEKTPSQVSRWIKGINDMPAEIISILTERLNFKRSYFDEFFNYKINGSIPENLTKEELIRLIYEQKLLINEYKEYSSLYSQRINKYIDMNHDLLRTNKRLIDENEDLRRKLRELKKESKNE